MGSDVRVPVEFGQLSDLRPGDALLILAGGEPDGVSESLLQIKLPAAHAIGCRCCAARDPWSEALAGLFVAMLRGEIRRFDRVLAVLDNDAAERLRLLLDGDRMVSARYRLNSRRAVN